MILPGICSRCRWSSTRSSRRGSPATSASTTCSTARATARPGPRSARWPSRSTCCCWSAAATTSSPRTSTCRSTTSRSVPAAGVRRAADRLLGHQADLPRACSARTARRSCTAARPARIVRHRTGEYFEVHEPLDEYSAGGWCSTRRPAARAAAGRRRERRPPPGARFDGIRRRLSRFFFEDRIEPVTPAELEAAHDEHHELAAGPHESAEQQEPVGSSRRRLSAAEPSPTRAGARDSRAAALAARPTAEGSPRTRRRTRPRRAGPLLPLAPDRRHRHADRVERPRSLPAALDSAERRGL